MKLSRNLAGLLGFVAALAAGSPAFAQAPVVAAGDADAGAAIYASDCKGCHATSIGPTLRGVFGRQIASLASFGGYSEGLKAKGGATWTAANLDVFLTSPAAFAPGAMMVKVIPDPQARADVIAYLASLPPPRS